MSDTPETQEAVERWRQGKINIFDEMARLERERNALSFEVSRLKYQRTETEASLKKCRKELDELNHRAEIDAQINKNFINQLIDMRTERDEAVAGLKFVANWSGGTDWPHHIIAGDILDCLNSKSKEDAE